VKNANKKRNLIKYLEYRVMMSSPETKMKFEIEVTFLIRHC